RFVLSPWCPELAPNAGCRLVKLRPAVHDKQCGRNAVRQRDMNRRLVVIIGHPDASERTPRLFADRRPQAAAAPGPPAAHRLAGAVAGRVGHGAADGAHGDLAAAGPADAARSSELDLARIRHARRFLAHEADARGSEDLTDADLERQGVRDLSAG